MKSQLDLKLEQAKLRLNKAKALVPQLSQNAQMTVADLHMMHRTLVLELDKHLTNAIQDVFNQEARKINQI